MSNLKNCSLVLNTYNATANTAKTSFTWSNINLRTLLGDMFDKYETFNLCLNTIHTSVPTALYALNTDDSNVFIKVSGLPFINNTYDVKGGNNTNASVIATYQFNNITPVFQYFMAQI